MKNENNEDDFDGKFEYLMCIEIKSVEIIKLYRVIEKL